MMRVGVCGGIGSGKSTVCRLFAERGAALYCSDERGRELTDTSPEIEAGIRRTFGDGLYGTGRLDRSRLADIVFGDRAALERLNAIVHPVVLRDFEEWSSRQQCEYVILESAILFESGFDAAVDFTLAVMAPAAIRIERAMQRDGVPRERILARMANQMSDDQLLARADMSIVNIERDDLLPCVAELDRRFRIMAAGKGSAGKL